MIDEKGTASNDEGLQCWVTLNNTPYADDEVWIGWNAQPPVMWDDGIFDLIGQEDRRRNHQEGKAIHPMYHGDVDEHPGYLGCLRINAYNINEFDDPPQEEDDIAMPIDIKPGQCIEVEPPAYLLGRE